MTKQTKRQTRSILKNRLWMGLPVGALSLFGMGCLDGSLAQLLSVFVLFLGVSPAGNFGQTGEVDFNLVQVADDGTNTSASDSGDDKIEIVVTDPPNTEATVDVVETGEVFDKGSFAIILDSSGSMEKSYTSGVCDLCPYDAERRRVDAAQVVIREVLGRSPESRIAVYDFGAGEAETFTGVRELAPYSSDEGAASKAADQTISEGGTFIYDSVYEVIDSMDSDVKEAFRTDDVNKAILIITDGEDTESTRSLSEVIEYANKFNIPVNVIGLGQASGNFNELYNTTEENTELIKSLRMLAGDTNGFYASVSSDQDLEELGEIVGIALAGGHDKVKVTLDPVPEPGSTVRGTIKNSDSAETTPLGQSSLTQWSFIAP